MTLKTALEQNALLTVLFLLAGGWIALTAMNVSANMGPLVLGDWVGQSGVGGLFGLGVMLVLGVLLVYLYAELAEADPAPDSFPPER